MRLREKRSVGVMRRVQLIVDAIDFWDRRIGQ